ncbi:ABC transporter substrate-binding protein [Methanobrevibacter filiformis]|uniref:Putative aliphatic sulfonates-binding protein n=1 Tax=Methanobrevibacter filiformis TaxID=55758 RepID=A0A166C8M7_9EURY|nr:ABC transporter substrate-binding protein [Methanobrevibacter filiformis]KZX12217.1 putative aliphatic sulfonates-binding protein precursor [Methanobrevibacter filiformis]
MDKKIIAIIALIVIIIVGAGAYFSLGGSNSSSNVVSIGYMPSDHHAALLIANATNQFEDKGIKVNLVQFNNGGDLMAAMASGDLDVGYVGITPALSSIAKGVPVKVISSVQNEGSGIVVSNESKISDIAGLKGKQVATPGASSIQYMLLLYALEKNGLKKEDLSISDMKVASMVDALKTKKIDGIVSYEPYVTQPVETGIGKEIASSEDILPGHPCCVIVAREDFIKNNENQTKAILDIHENATKYIKENPEEAVKLLPSDLFKENIEKNAIKNIKFTSGIDDSYVNKVLDFMNIEIDMGLLKKPLTQAQIFQKV